MRRCGVAAAAAAMRRHVLVASACVHGSAPATPATRVTLACSAAGILDPVTQTLTNFEDEADLDGKIDDIYLRLDKDGSGGLNYEVR